MRLRIYDPRILAIDLRHRRFGYAVYEGHKVLLDWGVRVYPAVGEAEAAMASRRLSSLIRLFSPTVMVFKMERWELSRTNPHMRTLVAMAESQASAHSVQIRLITDSDVKSSFRNMDCETRDEIAGALARIFPELSSYIPPKRRAWQAEHPRLTVFNAIALGLAYWHHPSKAPPDSLGSLQQDQS
jgi:hypothetical protein